MDISLTYRNMKPLKSQYRVPLTHTNLFSICQLHLCLFLQILSMTSQSSLSLWLEPSSWHWLHLPLSSSISGTYCSCCNYLWPLDMYVLLSGVIWQLHLVILFPQLRLWTLRLQKLSLISFHAPSDVQEKVSVNICMTNLLKLLLSLENSLRSFCTVRIWHVFVY